MKYKLNLSTQQIIVYLEITTTHTSLNKQTNGDRKSDKNKNTNNTPVTDHSKSAQKQYKYVIE